MRKSRVNQLETLGGLKTADVTDTIEDVNAWSFGPTMTIAQGQAATVGVNSFWTIANGEAQ